MNGVVRASIALGIALAGSTASAQGKVDNIGNAGGIVIGAERLVGVYHSKINTTSEQSTTVGGTTITSKSDLDTDRTTFAVFGNAAESPTQVPRLALDFFPIDGLSIGGSFMYLASNGKLKGTQSLSGAVNQEQKVDSKLPTESVLIFQPRLGYAFAFNDIVGLWPRAGFAYTHLVVKQEVTTTDAQGNEQKFDDTITVNLTNLTLEGMLFVSPFSNFAFVGGPFVDIPLGGSQKEESSLPNSQTQDSDSKLTCYSAMIGIAGYFHTQ